MLPRFIPVAVLLLAAGAAAAQEGERYRLVPSESDVHWRVYSAGAFARLGHNHVISAGSLSGSGEVAPAGDAVSFTIEIPAADLVVDDPELRKRYGESFASEPSADDIAGTRRNMLGEAVLNADQHPLIKVSGEGPLREGEVVLDLTVELAGHTAEIQAPATVSRANGKLVAEGAFQLTHTMLGMKPFSVMMGALQVADPMDFAYRIEAERDAATEALSPAPR